MRVQLLCTFVPTDRVIQTIDTIKNKYDIVGNKIFVLADLSDNSHEILTYNVRDMRSHDILGSTISVHKKKQTNTIYTINSLNEIIKNNNGGILDKTFAVNWNELKDFVFVIAYGKLKIIKTSLKEVIILKNSE